MRNNLFMAEVALKEMGNRSLLLALDSWPSLAEARVRRVSGSLTQAAGRYADVAPAATTCCNACRTCVQTNLLTAALAGVAAAGGVPHTPLSHDNLSRSDDGRELRPGRLRAFFCHLVGVIRQFG